MADKRLVDLAVAASLDDADLLHVVDVSDTTMDPDGTDKLFTVAVGKATFGAGLQPLDADLTAVAGLTPSNDDLLQRKAGAWTNRTPAQVKTDLAIANADVSGLQAALDAKAPLASPAFTGTPTGITKTHVGLGSADNTADTAKPVSIAQQAALDAKVALTGNETVAGIKTFSSSPLVPTPTTALQAVTKGYVDARFVLAAAVFNSAGSNDVYNTTSTTLVDVVAGAQVTVTVPASGSVVVTMSALCRSAICMFGIREGSTDVTSPVEVNHAATPYRLSASFLITGLTPGASKTYKAAFARSGGGGASVDIFSNNLGTRPITLMVQAVA